LLKYCNSGYALIGQKSLFRELVRDWGEVDRLGIPLPSFPPSSRFANSLPIFPFSHFQLSLSFPVYICSLNVQNFTNHFPINTIYCELFHLFCCRFSYEN
jgi:hypothetical protein